MKAILKANNKILTVQGKIFQVGDTKDPVARYRASTLQLAENSPVSIWPDVSGNGNHLFQSVATKQPIYNASAVNGMPSVRFDGINDGLLTTIQIFAKTVFVVVNNGPNTGLRQSLFGNYRDVAGGASFFFGGTETYFNVQGFGDTQPGNYCKFYINGGAAPFPYQSVPRNPGLYVLCLDIEHLSYPGNPLYNLVYGVGFDAGTNNFYYNGQFLDLIFYDYRLTALNRIKITNELLTEYGL